MEFDSVSVSANQMLLCIAVLILARGAISYPRGFYQQQQAHKIRRGRRRSMKYAGAFDNETFLKHAANEANEDKKTPHNNKHIQMYTHRLMKIIVQLKLKKKK